MRSHGRPHEFSFLESRQENAAGEIYEKLLRLGAFYKEHVETSEVVQVAVEGADRLETYFGAYLPQFFYAMLAPLTLFVHLCFVNVASAAVLLVCVPLNLPTSDIEPLEVFYAHTASPTAIALLFTRILCLFIGSFHPMPGVSALTAYFAVGIVIPFLGQHPAKYLRGRKPCA